MKRAIAAVALAAVACGTPTEPPTRGPSGTPAGAEDRVPVVRVVDGDTLWVLREGREEKIRLIGVDTPEVDWYGGKAECFGERAGAFARRLLDGARVRLETDREALDRYGRTLAYVWLEDGRMLNLLLVRRGFAVVTIYPPNDRYERELQDAEAGARVAGRGLWGACG